MMYVRLFFDGLRHPSLALCRYRLLFRAGASLGLRCDLAVPLTDEPVHGFALVDVDVMPCIIQQVEI
jgi:hypothetical protein